VPGRDLNLERSLGVRAGATVSNPAIADVFRLKEVEIGCREDEVVSRARTVGVDQCA
jgi:hypothetical protein